MRAKMLSWFGTLIAAAVGTGAGAETLDDFVVAGGQSLADFRPLADVETLGPLAFVAGVLPDPLLGMVEPTLLALRARDGSEAWRVSEEGFAGGFSTASADAGRVCAAGVESLGSFPVTERLLVACYDASRGTRLWTRLLDLDPGLFRASTLPSIRLEQRAVWVRLRAVSFAVQRDLVLLFDARDGGPR